MKASKSLEKFFLSFSNNHFDQPEMRIKCGADNNNIILKSIMFSLIACEFNKNCLENTAQKKPYLEQKRRTAWVKRHEKKNSYK